ncbi:MAG: hypothetical protein AMXMBFR47_39440 [Planctomycetota bacterium]
MLAIGDVLVLWTAPPDVTVERRTADALRFREIAAFQVDLRQTNQIPRERGVIDVLREGVFRDS